MIDMTIPALPTEVAQPADIRDELADARRAAALDALHTAAEVVGVTLRREVAGVWWDITLTSAYWRTGDGASRTLYHWDAERLTLDDTPPRAPRHGLGHFATPAAALADALSVLELGEAAPIAIGSWR